MRKLIICVKSCQRDLDSGLHDAIRSTWGRDARAAGIDVRFFVGAQDFRSRYASDEIGLACEDGYEDLPFKTREICKWASSKMLSHIFLCDTDTYVSIRNLLSSGWEEYDYTGMTLHRPNKIFQQSYTTEGLGGGQVVLSPCYTWCSGGNGYFLSLAAAREVAYAFPTCWAEDMFVGQVIGPRVMDGTYTVLSTRGSDYRGNVYSWHFSNNNPGQKDSKSIQEWMIEEHRKAR